MKTCWKWLVTRKGSAVILVDSKEEAEGLAEGFNKADMKGDYKVVRVLHMEDNEP